MKILALLDKNENISFVNLEKISKIKDKELRELLKYLKGKNYITWRSRLFINEHHIADDKISLAHNGMEVILGQKDYFGDSEKISRSIQKPKLP